MRFSKAFLFTAFSLVIFGMLVGCGGGDDKFLPSSIENTAFIDDPEINKLVTELKTVTGPGRTSQIVSFCGTKT